MTSGFQSVAWLEQQDKQQLSGGGDDFCGLSFPPGQPREQSFSCYLEDQVPNLHSSLDYADPQVFEECEDDRVALLTLTINPGISVHGGRDHKVLDDGKHTLALPIYATEPITIGRSKKNTVVIGDPRVSGLHLKFHAVGCRKLY